MPTPPRLLALLLCAPAFAAHAASKLRIEAGDQDRFETIVTFQAPKEMHGGYHLEGNKDGPLYLQVDEDGRAVFIEPHLGKGEQKTYTIAPKGNMMPVLAAKINGDVLELDRIVHYQMQPGPVPDGVGVQFRHGAHLHPVFSPLGRVVTGNHPPDHRWHRGIWFGWTDTDFEGRHPDFWNMGKEKSGELTGEVRFESLERQWSGGIQAGFVAHHRWIDHTSGAEKEVLKETWDVRAASIGSIGPKTIRANVIDLVSTQTLIGDTPLKLPKYYYGGLGVRGNAAWDPVEKVTMRTSEGLDRKTGDNSKARWVEMSGVVDLLPSSIAVLIHPDNFRFPQPLRLNPKNPQLCVAPSQEGDWSIEPGKPYVSKYRFVVTDIPLPNGSVDVATLERAWNDYAHPPKVTVE